eukprot:GEZU01016265.1.p1 GENE.GEZU01016265.1~~GEZU01016265.1.p1  ORF type:complete len:245 (-),score=47.82 GEZU01016265.1:455-1189(-)
MIANPLRSSVRIALHGPHQRVLHAIHGAASHPSTNCTILVHGADRKFQNCRHWEPHYKWLSSLGVYYAVDLLGHGTSEPGEKSPEYPSPQEQVDAVEKLVHHIIDLEAAQEGIRSKYTLIGRSYGGRIVLELAKRLDPFSINAMILIAPSANENTLRDVPSDKFPVMALWAKDDPVIPPTDARVNMFRKHFGNKFHLKLMDPVLSEEANRKGEMWRAHCPENERPDEFHAAVEEFLKQYKVINP